MIMVTGAAGRLGRLVVGRLIERGYEVLGTDRIPYDGSPAPFVQADLCDWEKTTGLLMGAYIGLSAPVIALGVATAGSVDPRIALLVACVAEGAFLGDNLCYLLGRRFGPAVQRR